MNPNKISGTFILAAALAPVVSMTGAGASDAQNVAALVLVEKGRTDFSIVIPSKASQTEEFAAKELQRHLGAYEPNHYVLGGLAWNPDADVPQRKATIEQLDRLIQDHAKDGVFVAERIPLGKQAGRYGLGK